jgi:hypothetical protein
MTTTCSSVTVIQNKLCFFMGKTSPKNAIYTSTIQSVIEYKIVSRLMSNSSTLIMEAEVGHFKVWRYTSISPYQGSKDAIRKISPLIGDSSGMISLDSTGSSEMSSAKTNDFLDFTETKSKSNSCKMTIHLLIFPPMTHHVNTYWKGLTMTMTVVLRRKCSDRTIGQHGQLPKQVSQHESS